MYQRVKAWFGRRVAASRERYIARLKAEERQHYREFLECNEVGKDLAHMAALKRAYARDAAGAVGENHEAVLEAQRDAIMYGEQSQQEYEAADFHYAAYIEARETYREATNS